MAEPAMLVQNRKRTVSLAASYLLAISVSALFHSHHGYGEDQTRPGVSASHSAEDDDCSICQFLAQKPVLAADVVPAGSSALVQEVAAPTTVNVAGGAFAAWHSRAPPVLA